MERAVDAFLAYNEREKSLVEPIAQWLASHGVETHFFARDKQYGEPIDDTGDMDNARTVIAFLGKAGWGKNHLRLVERAQGMNKRVFPVLIGDVNPGDGDMANRLFNEIKWVDVRNGNLEPLAELVPLIRAHVPQPDPEIDAAIQLLIAGPDERRQVALGRLIERSGAQRGYLGDRLREELVRYGTGVSASSSSSSSDEASSNRNAVARSWLRVALIRCDPENPHTQTIALRDIAPEAEPAEFGRFWSLAAAQRANVSYLRALAAIAEKDPEPSVSATAIALLDPHGETTIAEFRLVLTHGKHWTARGILRALRIVHVPEVLPDVVALAAGENRAEVPMYDVFCALAAAPARDAAAQILKARLGIDGVVDRVIEAAYDANRAVTQSYAELLAAVDAAQSRTALQARTEQPQVRAVARRLLLALDTVDPRGPEPYRHRPGFSADTIDEQDDQLGIQTEVQTLAAIMTARDVTPPLAIGLFGEWGSGKSFFMSQMRKTVDALARPPTQQETSPYCSGVVQITFNAWHYAETNLWASLVSAIFENLAEHVFRGKPSEREKAALIAELVSAKAVTDEARAEERRAGELLQDEEARLDALRKRRLAEEQKLAKFNPTYLVDLLDDKALKKEAEQAFEKLGLPVVLDRIDDFKHAVADAGKLSSRTVALLKVLADKGRSPLYVALFVAALAVPAVGYAVYQALPPDNRLFTTIGTALAGIGTFVAAAAEIVRRGMREVNGILAPIVKAKEKADEELDKIRAQTSDAELDLAARIEVLKAKEQDARRRVAEAAERVAATEERLRELEESRDFAHFIADRHDSADYRKHLGLVSLVRQDFEALAARIRDHGSATAGGHKVDRIVLYIDDLDRCPASQVVDVLQAVHLLLAYPLFVVVVGVDPRWLANSLALHYKELDAARPEAPEAAARPLQYLEKIFQIPYSLRPMSPEGYARLVGELMTSGARASATPAPRPASPAAVAPNPASMPAAAGARPASPQTDALPALASEAAAPAKQPLPAPSPAPVEERALVIHAWEEEFAKRLYRLIPSPRAAKRLINVYRVLKAGVGGAQLQAFEGSEAAPGQFQVPLLLLAMQICDAAATAAWFRALLEPGVAQNATAQALERTAKDAADPARARLMARIQPVVMDPDFPAEPALLAHWIPLVSRFTFDPRSIA